LSYNAVSGILTQGGTILGSNNKANPFSYAVAGADGKVALEDLHRQCLAHIRKWKLDAIVCIGGDGTFTIAGMFDKLGVPMVCVPKTIDNDVVGTELTVGFDSAVSVATSAIDKLHTTAMSHHRVMIVEVMGRYAGWLALTSGVAGGGDVILIPEIPYDLQVICRFVEARSKRGRRFSIVVVAEGARPRGGKMMVGRIVENSPEKIRLGGIGNHLAEVIESCVQVEARSTVLGHLQRGGEPTSFDRVLATQMGVRAAELAAAGRFGRVVVLRRNKIADLSIKSVAGATRKVSARHPLIVAARSVGTSFGV
jgi:6-phosphofructokinase 1